MSLGKIEHSLLHDHDVVKKPGLLRPNEIKQLRPLNKGSLIFGCNTSQPQAPTVHKRSRIIKAAIDDVLHHEMYEVLFTLLRIFSAFRKFGAPGTCELGNGHPPLLCETTLTRLNSPLHFH